MSIPSSWLSAEIDRWTSEQIITPAQAARLRALYPADPPAAPARSWGLLVFFGIGAVVVGLGVILLFAYNWDALTKELKLALVFGGVAAAHAGGLWARERGGWQATLGEALSLLGTMGFGAGIWLVAQIYHINEHFPNGFLIWGLGALAMAWALKSVSQGLIAGVTLVTWGSTELGAFESPQPWAVPLLLLGLAPLAWHLRSAVLTATLAAGLYLLLPWSGAYWAGGGGSFLVGMTWATALLAIRHVVAGHAPPAVVRVLGGFGLTGFLVCAFILSFEDATRHLLRVTPPDVIYVVPWVLIRWSLLLAVVAGWGLLGWRALQGGPRTTRLEDALFPLTTVLVHLLTWVDVRSFSGLIALVFNLVVLGWAAMTIVRGCREGRLRAVVLGTLLLGAVVFARYFDLFDSLAARGLAFIVFGAVLFAEGFYYKKLRPTPPEVTP